MILIDYNICFQGIKPIVEDDKNFKAPYRYAAETKEKVEGSRCFSNDEHVASVKKLKKSSTPEHQNVNCASSSSSSQSSKNSQIERTHHLEKSQINESLSECESRSHQNIRIPLKLSKTQNNEAAMKAQFFSSLNQSPSHIKMPVNKENLSSKELRHNSVSDSLVSSPVKHLHLNNAAPDVEINEIHKVGLTKQVDATHGNPAEDEYSSGNIPSVDKSESASVVHSPVKVKTIKMLKLPSKIDTSLHVPDNQCRKVLDNSESELQRSGMPCVSTQVSTVIRQEERLSYISLLEPPADMGEKMVVIFLSENRFGDLLIDKIEKTANHSCPNTDIHSTVRKEVLEDKTPDLQKQKRSCASQSGIAVTDEMTKRDKLNYPHISSGNFLNQAGDSLQPGRGMESNLHSHINYLSDLQVQCPNNHTPATPAALKHGQLDGSYTNSDYFSTDKVRLMMQKEDGRVKCRKCGVTTTYRAFYKHARKHFNIKPFKCGYCSYRSIEKSKVRVHNTFCHPILPPVIQKLSPESAGIDCNISNGCEVNLKKKSRSKEISDITDQVGSKKFYREDLMNISHSSSGISINAKPETFISTRQSLFQCPLCSKFLQKHAPSVRRHLYSHYSYKPYKCGYCSFMGIGPSEVSFFYLCFKK